MRLISAFLFGSALPVMANAVMDDVNGSATPPVVNYAGPNNIGWYITSNSTYMLDGIFTTFRPVPNGTGLHTITAQIWTDRPSPGRTLLGDGTFNIDSAVGGDAGVTFAPVLVTAGRQYFVDFLNTIGMRQPGILEIPMGWGILNPAVARLQI